MKRIVLKIHFQIFLLNEYEVLFSLEMRYRNVILDVYYLLNFYMCVSEKAVYRNLFKATLTILYCI